MPVPPSILKTIHTIRKIITTGCGKEKDTDFELYVLIGKLFRGRDKIINNAESIDAILALAPDIQAYRGKGSQNCAKEFDQRLTGLILHANMHDSGLENRQGEILKQYVAGAANASAIPWHDKLSTYFFQRVQGPPVRSRHAASLRAIAWFALGELSKFGRHTEHYVHALKVAADPRAAELEREGAIQFLEAYWDGDEPDAATADLLDALEKAPPSRRMLVTILQTQIELGLKEEFGALFAVENWDDANERHEQNGEA